MKCSLGFSLALVVYLVSQPISAATYAEFSTQYHTAMLDACEIATFFGEELRGSKPSKGELISGKTKTIRFSNLLTALDNPEFRKFDLKISNTDRLKGFLTIIDNAHYEGEAFVLKQSDQELLLMFVGDRSFSCNTITNIGELF